MQTTMDLSGLWEVRLGDGAPATVHLPGTLEENGLGEPETPALESRLTRRFRWEGEAVFSREVTLPDHPGRRLILEAERARQLRLTVDGQPVPTLQGTLSTPYLFELTRWAGRRVRLCLLSDNRYPGWPREEIVHASAATDETQTNWNGLLGRLCVHSVADFWVRSVRVYPHGRTLDAAVDLAVPRQARSATANWCWKAPPWPGRSACSGGTGSRNRCGRGFAPSGAGICRLPPRPRCGRKPAAP